MAMAPRSNRDELHSLAGSTPAPSALTTRALGRSAQAPAFQAGQAGSIPAGHSARAGMGYKVTTDGSSPSGTTLAQIRQAAERLGLNPGVCRFNSYPKPETGGTLDHPPAATCTLSARSRLDVDAFDGFREPCL